MVGNINLGNRIIIMASRPITHKQSGLHKTVQEFSVTICNRNVNRRSRYSIYINQNANSAARSIGGMIISEYRVVMTFNQ
jgi:hypothetical protein